MRSAWCLQLVSCGLINAIVSRHSCHITAERPCSARLPWRHAHRQQSICMPPSNDLRNRDRPVRNALLFFDLRRLTHCCFLEIADGTALPAGVTLRAAARLIGCGTFVTVCTADAIGVMRLNPVSSATST